MYTQISYNSEPKVIGVNNGVYQLELDEKELEKSYNYPEIEEILFTTDINKFLQNQDKIPTLKIETLKWKLLKKAKLTDIMVFSLIHLNT